MTRIRFRSLVVGQFEIAPHLTFIVELEFPRHYFRVMAVNGNEPVELARLHIEWAQALIVRQRAHVERLKRFRMDSTQAEIVLAQLLNSLEKLRAQADLIVEDAMAGKPLKRPRDPLALAKPIGDIAAEQVEDRAHGGANKEPAAIERGRGALNGRKTRAKGKAANGRKAVQRSG